MPSDAINDSEMSKQFPATASDLMRAPAVTIGLEAMIADVAESMLANRIGSLVVVDANGDYRGIVTEQAFLPNQESFPLMRGTVSRIMGVNTGADQNVNYQETIDKVRGMKVSEVMNEDGPSASPDTPIDEIAEMMAISHCQHVPIVSDGKPVGIVARHDILRLFVG